MRLKSLEREFTFKIGEKEFKGDLASDLKIDVNNINEEFSNQPAIFAWWATLASIANEIHQKKKLQRKILEAELDKEKRKELEATKGRKVTERIVEREVMLDDRWKQAYLEEIEAGRQASILSAATEALRQRKDMLTSLGLQLREEMRSEQVIKEVASD